MSNIQKIGKWVLGLTGLALFVHRQQLKCVVKGVYLNGLITADLIPLAVVVELVNTTIGSILVRSISGVVTCNGMVVATVDQMVNKRIGSHGSVEQIIQVNLNKQEALQTLFDGYNTGSVTNLAFDFNGEIVVGQQYPVKIRFSKYFTWNDVQKML